MTVKELAKKLRKFPQDAEICVKHPNSGYDKISDSYYTFPCGMGIPPENVQVDPITNVVWIDLPGFGPWERHLPKSERIARGDND